MKRDVSSVRPVVVDGAGEWLRGKRCAVVGIGVQSLAGESLNPDCLAAKLIESVKKVGSEVVTILDHVSPFNSAGELDVAFAGVDVLFLVGQFISFRRDDRRNVWRMNVDATRAVYLAAEQAGVKRIVAHGSILSLGHNQDGSPVDVSSPYLSDDRRTECEKALFRAEMEAWQMSERGFDVSVVCSGLIVDDSMINLGLNANDINKKPHLFSSSDELVSALIAASADGYIGRRLICAGLSQGKPLPEELVLPSPDNVLLRLLGRDRRSRTLRALSRLGTYVSDFPVTADK